MNKENERNEENDYEKNKDGCIRNDEGGYAYVVSVTKKITKDEILQIVEEIVKK